MYKIPSLLALPAGLIFTTAVLADHPSLTVLGGPAGPVTTQTASTVPQGEWSTGFRAEYVKFDAFSDEQLAQLSEENQEGDIHSVDSLTSISIGAAYGVSDNLTLGFTLPYIKRENIREAGGHHDEVEESDDHHDEEEGEVNIEELGDSSGIGDTVLYGQYRFLNSQDNKVQSAIIFGVKTPTGKTDVTSNEGHLLEVDLQPGSGSWDPMLGGAVTKVSDRLAWNASFLYKIATEGSQDTTLGDTFAYNGAVSYSLTTSTNDDHHHSDHEHTSSEFSLLLELNGEWHGKDDLGDHDNPNTGGNILFVSPGARYSSDKWNASLSIGLPVSTDLNGVQVEPDWRAIAGISAGF